MSVYDRWLEAPYTDEPEVCERCDGEGDIDDPDGVFDRIVCPRCGGSGRLTREEIREAEADRAGGLGL